MSDLSEGAGDETSLRANVEQVSGAMKGAAENVAAAVEAGKRPGMPLDVVIRVTREAPLASLCVAFLLGVAVARRR